jgi:hypothetical protein
VKAAQVKWKEWWQDVDYYYNKKDEVLFLSPK